MRCVIAYSALRCDCMFSLVAIAMLEQTAQTYSSCQEQRPSLKLKIHRKDVNEYEK